MSTNNIFWRKHWSMIFTIPTLILFIYSGLWYAWNALLILIGMGEASIALLLVVILTGLPLGILFAPAMLTLSLPFSIAGWHEENMDKNAWERSIKTILMLIGSLLGPSVLWMLVVYASVTLISVTAK